MISIIMPVHNEERFIKEAIESIINQTYKDWELIIIDDESTDKSPLIIKDFTERDSRIKYVKTERLKSPAKLRNLGLRNAKGQYISFLDSDDLFYENSLELLLENFNKDERLQVITGTKFYIDEDGSECEKQFVFDENKLDIKNINKNFNYLKSWWGTLGSCMIKREFFDEIGSFNEDLTTSDDGEFILRAFVNAFSKIKFIPKYIYKQRFKNGSLTKNSERALEVLGNRIKAYELFLKNPKIASWNLNISKIYLNTYLHYAKQWLKLKDFKIAYLIIGKSLSDPNIKFLQKARIFTRYIKLKLRDSLIHLFPKFDERFLNKFFFR